MLGAGGTGVNFVVIRGRTIVEKKRYQKSKISGVVSIRLPNEVLFTIQRRINGRRGRWESVGEYLQERIIYDTMRAHARRNK